MTFGQQLRSYRLDKGLTQEEAAQAIGISRRAYIDYEQDRSRPRDKETYQKLADLYNCKVNDFYKQELDQLATTTKATVDITPLKNSFMKLNAVLQESNNESFSMIKQLSQAMEQLLSYINSDDVKEIIQRLREMEKSRKRAKNLETGILLQELAKRGITCSIDAQINKKDEHQPDLCLHMTDQPFQPWWLDFYPVLDKEFEPDMKSIAFSKYVSLPEDANRKVSVVLDSRERYEDFIQYQKGNSYKGNMTAILIDSDEGCVVEEKLIAAYAPEEKEQGLVVFH